MGSDALGIEIKAFDLAPLRAKSAEKPVVVFFDGKPQEWFELVDEAYLRTKDRFPANCYRVRDVLEETPFLPLVVLTH
jgi:hypothetical protein